MTGIKKIAVLIDSDNTPHSKLDLIIEELSTFGKIVVKRAYGDFSTKYLKNWKNPLNKLAIQPRQQFAYTSGKNSTDSVMIIDAMDLLYSLRFDVFALVSSDSDFTSLATRLRESEVEVIGVGKTATTISFKNSCDQFISIEKLGFDADIEEEQFLSKQCENKDNVDVSADKNNDINDLWNFIIRAWLECKSNNRWAKLSDMLLYIESNKPDFKVCDYGLNELVDFFDLYPDRYEIFPLNDTVEVRYIPRSNPKLPKNQVRILDLPLSVE